MDDYKILGILFNNVKRKSNNSQIDFNLYSKLISNDINENNLNYKTKQKFIWDWTKIHIISNNKKDKNSKENEDRLFNCLLRGYPKEVIKYSLTNYFLNERNEWLNNSKIPCNWFIR